MSIYDFWSIGYCGVIPLNENEATLLGVMIIIRIFNKLKKGMQKLTSNLYMVILVVSSLFAKDYKKQSDFLNTPIE